MEPETNESFLSTAGSNLPKLKINKKISVILTCFLFSVVFWFLLALSNNFTTHVTFPIRYENMPDGKAATNQLASRIELTINTSGFKNISYRTNRHQDSITIDVASLLTKSKISEDDAVVIPTRSLNEVFGAQLGNETSIVSYNPDSIAFSFSKKVERKIPVRLNAKIEFEKQFGSNNPPSLFPDSVLISGPEKLVASTHFIETDFFEANHVRENIKKKIPLQKNKLLSTDADEINVQLDVEKFTEGSVEIPVHAIGIPTGYSFKMFPDKITVRYLVSLSNYAHVNASGFSATVDASTLSNQENPMLKVSLLTEPSFVNSVVLEPEKVNYLLHKK